MIEKKKSNKKKIEFTLPEELDRYKDVEILKNVMDSNDERKKSIEMSEKNVLTVDVTLTKEEEEVLKLPPKFAIHKKLTQEDLEEA